jgi:hypothetical protein
MKLQILDNSISFGKLTDFSKKLKSPSGSVFSATTRPNERKITINVEKVAKAGITEHILKIPLNNKSYALKLGLGGQGLMTVIRGPEPQEPLPKPVEKPGSEKGAPLGHFIAIGGPDPGEPSEKKSAPVYIELDSSIGNWLVEHGKDELNISFDASKFKK